MHARLVTLLLVFSCLSPLLSWPSEARADRDEEARIHFNAGAAYYSRGEYERALQEFLLAHDLSQRPALFYNIALSHQQLGQLPEAAAALERYLAELPDAPDREVLESRLANLKRRIAERDAAEAEAEAERLAAEAALAESRASEGAESEEAPASKPRRGPPPAWAYAGFGAGLAGAAVAGVFGGLALQHKNGIEADCGSIPACSPSDVARMDRFALVADIGLGVAVAGTVVGVVGLLVKRAPREESGLVQGAFVAPLVDARAGTLGLNLGGRF